MGRWGRVKQLIKTVTSRHGVPKPCGGIHQDTESREVLEAKVPLIIVQFQQDYFCNPQSTPTGTAGSSRLFKLKEHSQASSF